MKTKLLIIFTVLCMVANAQYTKLYDFDGPTNGSNPLGAVISDGTFLYGITQTGGTGNQGTIFKIMPDGTGYSKLLDFTGTANGGTGTGSLLYSGTFLYGVTRAGGVNNKGTMFKIMPNGTGYVKLLDFAGATNGSLPYGSLISDGTFLYGMTNKGGANDFGTIFKIMPDGTGYVKLLDFDDAINGSEPTGSLFYDGTFLYGMTTQGGINDYGTIFKIMPDGTGYLKLLNFAGVTNGSYPYGNFSLTGGYLYGMTNTGGATNQGTLFRIMPNGTGFAKLLDFSGTANGANPYGSLISDGTSLYGMTFQGGANSMGVIFKIMPDGTGYSKLLDFAGSANGRSPWGSLFYDGTSFYGMTTVGGTNNLGTVFKFGTTIGIEENYAKADFKIYPNPFSSSTTLKTEKHFVDATLTVYNPFGQQVKQIQNISGQTITLHRDNLPGGLYFVRLTEDSKTITTNKLIITD